MSLGRKNGLMWRQQQQQRQQRFMTTSPSDIVYDYTLSQEVARGRPIAYSGSGCIYRWDISRMFRRPARANTLKPHNKCPSIAHPLPCYLFRERYVLVSNMRIRYFTGESYPPMWRCSTIGNYFSHTIADITNCWAMGKFDWIFWPLVPQGVAQMWWNIDWARVVQQLHKSYVQV